MRRKFECVKDCSDCCVNRQYYPSVEYGKIGVLILPEEKNRIERLATKNGVDIKIIPRLGVGIKPKDGDDGGKKKSGPRKVIAYQMMGRNSDGTLCPFLDIEGSTKAPHGGYKCKIYESRPLACQAYPVINLEEKSKAKAALDGSCRFCSHHSTTSVTIENGLQKEIEALAKIKQNLDPYTDDSIWRYATAVGNPADKDRMLAKGWIIQ